MPSQMLTADSKLPVEEVAKRLVTQKHPWLIDPRKSKRIGYWDGLTSLALIFTALVTPYEIALLSPSLDPLFYVNRVVDGTFLIDILVQFITMTEHNAQSASGATWVTSPWQIARNYLASWFVLDLFTVAISGLDVMSVFSGSGGVDLSKLTVLKTLRVLRLIKLARLLRTSRIAKRWETRISVDYSMLQIAKCVVGVIITAHWVACVWLLQAFLLAETPMPSWLGDDGYCTRVEAAVDPLGYICKPPAELYLAALYFSVMTITSIGYGDIGATPYNPAEQAVCTAIMLTSSLVWAQVIGTYCGVVATLNPELRQFRETMDDLNRFMSRECLPTELRRRLREYFHQSKHLHLAATQHGIMEQMPPSLKGEVSWCTNQSWLSKIWFLKAAPQAFMVELAMSLHAMVYAPADTPRLGYLYIVHRGIAIYRAKLVTKGRVFGEDSILASPHLRSNAQAKAMNYLEVYFISRRELLQIAQRYPRTAAAIRRAAVLLALRREIILLAKARLGASPGDKISAAILLAQNGEQKPPTTDGAAGAASSVLFGADAGAQARRGKAAADELPDELPVGFEDDEMGFAYAAPSPSFSPKGRAGSPMGLAKQGGAFAAARSSGYGGRPASACMGASAGGGGGGGGSASLEISRLRAELRSEHSARVEATQRQERSLQMAVEMIEKVAKRIEDVADRAATSKVRRHRGERERYSHLPILPTDGSVTSVAANGTTTATVMVAADDRHEDRHQDGEREAHRDRPKHFRRRVVMSAQNAASESAMLAALAASRSGSPEIFDRVQQQQQQPVLQPPPQPPLRPHEQHHQPPTMTSTTVSSPEDPRLAA